MDRDKIIGLFTSGNPDSYRAEDGKDSKAILHDIVSTFPYFQLAQVLYARHVYNDNDTNITGQVKLASAYSPNRRAMYMLFKKPVEKKVEPLAAPVTKEVKEEVKYNFVYQTVTREPVTKQEAFVSDVVMTPETEPKKEKKEEAKSALSETFLEKEILGNIAVAKVEKELSETPLMPVEERKLSEPLPVKETKEEPKKVDHSHEIHSFEDWLKLLPETSVKTKTGQAKIEEKAPEKATDIINRFLSNEPRISRPKAEFFSPAKAARQSVAEDDDLVSETLAKILVQQGNLHRALKAYETLLLQNPQKKAYFAARIKEIRQLIETGKH